MRHRSEQGMEVVQHAGWYVRHIASGLPMSPTLRLRRHAVAAMADLAATGVDFRKSVDDLRGKALNRAQQAAQPWYRRYQDCCVDGEHYNPYTYALPSGRCTGGLHGQRGKPQ